MTHWHSGYSRIYYLYFESQLAKLTVIPIKESTATDAP
jgi:hypothetical protein